MEAVAARKLIVGTAGVDSSAESRVVCDPMETNFGIEALAVGFVPVYRAMARSIVGWLVVGIRTVVGGTVAVD